MPKKSITAHTAEAEAEAERAETEHPSKGTSIHDILLDLGRRGQAAFVLLMASNMEALLEELIKTRMPHLSNTLREKLFTNLGPFASFSAKIDVAYAMGLVSANLQQDLHLTRKIRIKFAHPKSPVHFDVEEVFDLLKRYRDFDSEMDRYAFFGERARKILDELHQIATNSAMAAFLLRGGDADKQSPSPKKS